QVLLGFTPPGGQTPEQFLASQFPGSIMPVPNIVVPQSGSVDWNTGYQRIDGFGASSAFSGRTWSTNTADIFFSTNNGVVYFNHSGTITYTNNGLGLSLLRNQIQPGGYADASELGLMQL